LSALSFLAELLADVAEPIRLPAQLARDRPVGVFAGALAHAQHDDVEHLLGLAPVFARDVDVGERLAGLGAVGSQPVRLFVEAGRGLAVFFALEVVAGDLEHRLALLVLVFGLLGLLNERLLERVPVFSRFS